MEMERNLRTCTQALVCIIKHHRTVEQALKNTTSPLLWQVVKGTLQHYHYFSDLISEKTSFKSKDFDVHVLIVCSLYQMHCMHKVSPSALIHHATNVCKTLKKRSLAPVVFSTLRALKSTPLATCRTHAATLSLPAWLYKTLKTSWSEEAIEQMAHAWRAPPASTSLRVVAAKMSTGTYQSLLQKHAIAYEASPYSPFALTVHTNALNVPQLETGCVYIQNLSHQLVTSFLPNLPAQSRVLDACAAPGGKTGALLNHQPTLRIVCNDVKDEHHSYLAQNLSVYGEQVQSMQHDFTYPAPAHLKKFDAALIDAPCSGLGSLRKHPETKCHQSRANIHALQQKQRDILQNVWNAIKPGGYALYSTCTLTKQENQSVIRMHLAANHDARVVTLAHPLTISVNEGLLFVPNEQLDGAFVSLLRKTHGDDA